MQEEDNVGVEAEQSWEVPGEEGEVSLIGSSTGDITHMSEGEDGEEEEEEGELSIPAVPWSGVPEVHSSPLALPAGDGSRDISLQDLAAPNFSGSFAGSPGMTMGSLQRHVPSPLSSPYPAQAGTGSAQVEQEGVAFASPIPRRTRGRFSSGLHHLRNASTDSAALFNTRPSLSGPGSSPSSGCGIAGGMNEGDVSNLLSTTFEGMYGSSTMAGMDTAEHSGFGMGMGTSIRSDVGMEVVRTRERDEYPWDGDEGDSSFGLLPVNEDEATIRRRLSAAAAGSPTGAASSKDGTGAGASSAHADIVDSSSFAFGQKGREEVDPFAPVKSVRRSFSPVKVASDSPSPLLHRRNSRISIGIDPPTSSSADRGASRQSPSDDSRSSSSRSSHSRSRSHSASPIKQDVSLPIADTGSSILQAVSPPAHQTASSDV